MSEHFSVHKREAGEILLRKVDALLESFSIWIPVTPGSKGRRQRKCKVCAEKVKRTSGKVESTLQYTASSVMFHFVLESALKLSTQREGTGWCTKIHNSYISRLL